MRDICEILDVDRSSFYYEPSESPSEAVLLAEIEKLAAAYPSYGYRRITQMLKRQGYTVGTRRVARLMRENNLLVAVKRASCRTTKSLQGEKPWSNLLENLEISREDQVWVADCRAYAYLDHNFANLRQAFSLKFDRCRIPLRRMWAFLMIHLCDKIPDVLASLIDVLILSEVNGFFFNGADDSFSISILPRVSPPCDRNLNAMCLERVNISI